MLRHLIDKTLDWLLIIQLAVMSLVVAANVFFRFVLNQSIYWADELAMILMVWLTFLGAAVAIRDRAHYLFAWLIHKLEGRALKIYIVTGHLFMIAATLLLGWHSFQVTAGITDWIMPALEISRAWVYAAAPTGCVFMLYYSIGHLIQAIREPAATIPSKGEITESELPL
ncbi:MAG: TRAP transporter small permease [Balneolaceae bacterium]